MIKFFRKIRQNLVMQNKISKYFKYAIGEIILVMIGILLALQVNDWNDKRILKSKEQIYLKQIKISLQNDLERIKEVKVFNAKKVASINATFIVLEQSNPEKYIPAIVIYMNELNEFDVFKPNAIAFENMIASENINLITNMELRNNLSLYYQRRNLNITQERVKETTRQFVDDISPKIGNKQLLKQYTKHDSQLPDISEVNIHSDTQVFSNLLIMNLVIDNQNKFLDTTSEDIKLLLDLIENNLKT